MDKSQGWVPSVEASWQSAPAPAAVASLPPLWPYALRQMDNLRVLQRGESQQVLIAYMVRDLYRFCKQGNAQIRATARRSGMSRDQIIHREIAFTRYLLLVGLQPTIQGSQHG